MSCTTSDMQIIRRDDVAYDITFVDVDGDPINLTGATVFFTVKRKLTDVDADAVIEKEITVFTTPLLGVATLNLTNSETNIAPGDYFFDIQLKTVDGKIASSVAGKFFVLQDVTIRTS